MMWVRAAAIAVTLGSAHAQPAVLDAPALFDRANAAFRQGLELWEQNPDAARSRFREAAAAYETIASEVRNERLLVNLGNAYLLAGDTGRAVLQYRRAQRLAPADAAAEAGLEAARARVGLKAGTGGTAPSAWLSAWRRSVPAALLWTLCAAAWCAGWLLRAAEVERPRLVLALWTLGALGGALNVAERWGAARADDAVVTRDGAIGLNGPAPGVYEPTFDTPLAAGLEVRIVEARAGWLRVALADGRETWLPQSALERV